MKNPWKYKDVEYFTIMEVVKGIHACESLDDAVAMIDAYCKYWPGSGYGNLCYFMNNPYQTVFTKFHEHGEELRKLKEMVTAIEHDIAIDFGNSELSKRRE